MPTAKNYGEKGKSRVRVWEPRPGSNLSIAVWKDGKLTGKKTLGHRDWNRADATAAEVVAALERVRLEQGEPAPVAQNGRVRLGPLVARYLQSPSFKALTPKEQVRKRSRLEMLVAFFGPGRDVGTFDEDDVKYLQQCRKKGLEGLPKATGQQTMYADFSALRSVLRWACRTKDEQGQKLLREYPLTGVSVNHNTNPEQVVITHDEFTTLRHAARRLAKRRGPRIGDSTHYRVFLLMVEGTGRRMGSVLALRWSDLDLERGTVLWRGEEDKMGTETWVALPRHLVRVLKVWRTRNPDTLYVFQKRDGRRGFRPGQVLAYPTPFTDNAGYKWMGYIWDEAGMQKPARAGWHSLRRKWVTERKDLPDADVMAAGGWKSVSAFKRYQRPDPETTRSVIERPTRRLMRGQANLPHQPTPTSGPMASVSHKRKAGNE